MRRQVHQRIFTVTKYWIQHHPADWSEKLISTLNNFIDNTLISDGYTNMAKQLRNAIAKMVHFLCSFLSWQGWN